MILDRFERLSLPLKVVLLFVPALAARLIYSLLLVGPTQAADTPLFYGHAVSVLAGAGFGWPDRPPAFPYVMAALLKVFGGYPTPIVIYQCLLSAAVAPLIYLAGRNLFGERAGTLAGWFSVVHYPLIDYPRFVQSDIQFVFMVALTTWALSVDRSWRRTALGGVLLGVCALTRGTALAYFPFVLALGLTRLGPRAEGWARRAGRVALVVGLAGLMLMPWTVRNAREYGTFVPVSSEGGLNFFQGATPGYLFTRETDLTLARELTGWTSGNNDELIRPENQGALMGYWWRQWREQPGMQAALRVLSFLDFWSPVERVRFYALGPGNIYWAVTYGLLLPFFALGLYRIVWRRLPGAYFALAAIAGTTLLHTLTHAEQARYRGLSIEPLIVLIAMYGWVEWRRGGWEVRGGKWEVRVRVGSRE